MPRAPRSFLGVINQEHSQGEWSRRSRANGGKAAYHVLSPLIIPFPFTALTPKYITQLTLQASLFEDPQAPYIQDASFRATPTPPQHTLLLPIPAANHQVRISPDVIVSAIFHLRVRSSFSLFCVKNDHKIRFIQKYTFVSHLGVYSLVGSFCLGL